MDNIRSKVHFYCLVGIALFLPLSRQLTVAIIVVMILNWLFDKTIVSRLKELRQGMDLVLVGGIYLFYLASILWTSNMGMGWFDLEVKLSLIIFPLIMASSSPLGRKNFGVVLSAFVGGNVIGSLIDLGAGGLHAMQDGSLFFDYKAFSIFHHPGYFALYLNFGIALLVWNKYRDLFGIPVLRKVTWVLVALFGVMIFILSAKMAILTLGLMVLTGIAALIYHKKYRAGLGLMGGIAVVMFLLVTLLPNTRERLGLAAKVIAGGGTMERSGRFAEGSTELRLLVWKAAGKVIMDKPLVGTGVGDAKDALLAEYQARDLYGAVERNLNAHNQFLQTGVALGLLGALWLAALIFIPLYRSFRAGQMAHVLFLGILVLYALTESVLEVQAGVTFFAFFHSLFIFNRQSS